MIDGIPTLSALMIDSEPQETRQAIPRSQATAFLNLFLQTIARDGVRNGDDKGTQNPSKPSMAASRLSAVRMPSFPLLETAFEKQNPKSDAIRFVLEQEGGGYVQRDAGKESSKYGVLQATARRLGYDGNVRNLSRQEATRLYEKIWEESGAERLPRDLALVHFDTYVNSPAAAVKMLKSSGGDPDAYLDLRSRRYKRIAAVKPDTYGKYVKGWMNRIQNLRSLVAEDTSSLSARATS